MKTFKDLEFIDRSLGSKQAKLFFENGFGVSVITGGYGYKNQPYELAVLYGDKSNFELHYENEVSNGDVIGWLDSLEVTDLMIKVQNFKKTI